jgi:N-acylglucosamine-6-phosphate 2-epimerase
MPAELLNRLRGGLIVSCQALPGEPLFGSHHMAALARAAAMGGAVGIRANSPADIAAIRAAVDLPVIGINKVDIPGFEVYITPTLADVELVSAAGADIIAFDASLRPHPTGLTVKAIITAIHERTGKPAMADISTLAEGMAAAEAGADLVSTTLSGYTPYSPAQAGPDFELVERLALQLGPSGVPVIAEGRIISPDQAYRALSFGAFAVVVGGAITRPQMITARFVQALR